MGCDGDGDFIRFVLQGDEDIHLYLYVPHEGSILEWIEDNDLGNPDDIALRVDDQLIDLNGDWPTYHPILCQTNRQIVIQSN